jgi:hypothetical protein
VKWMLGCVRYTGALDRGLGPIPGGSDLKVVGTLRVKALLLLLWQYCRQDRFGQSLAKGYDLTVALTPCKQRYTLKLSAIAVNLEHICGKS